MTRTLTAHLLGMYIGQKCDVTGSEWQPAMKGCFLFGVDDNGVALVKKTPESITVIEVDWHDVVLHLRPTSSMTEKEEDENTGAYNDDNVFVVAAELTMKLTSMGFDVFNLIPSGLALDATTVKK